MQVVRAHLLHVRRVVLKLASMRHRHVFEHLLLRYRNVSAHRARSILVHLLHLGRARALVPHHLLVIVVLGLVHMVLGRTKLRRSVGVEQRARLIALILLQVIHQLLAGGLRILDRPPHVALRRLVRLLMHEVVDPAAHDGVAHAV